MASISKDPKTGTRRIQFKGVDGKRKTIYLPGETLANARTIKGRVEALLSAAHAKYEWSADLAKWVGDISDDLAAKLAKNGLIQPRSKPKDEHEEKPVDLLKEFLDAYVQGRTKLKPNTLRNYETTRRLLVEHFGSDRPIASITAGDADDWREALKAKYSVATMSREVKRARQFFKAAVRKKIIASNPFIDLETPAQVNSSRNCFVTRDVIDKVIDACPGTEWRLIVALSRYGGLRCPSEHLALRWTDVDWAAGKIRVRSPKTEHCDGGEYRDIPLFPELRPYLEEAFDPEATYVITRFRDTNANLRTQLLRIIKRAGVQPWPRLFHNLRASRETELAREHPIHVACDWIGNSALIAQKHYLGVTEADFEKALRATTHETTQSGLVSVRQDLPNNKPPTGLARKRKGWQADTDIQYPTEESNLVLRIRSPPCRPEHLQGIGNAGSLHRREIDRGRLRTCRITGF